MVAHGRVKNGVVVLDDGVIPSRHAMNSDIDEFLDEVDRWKFKVHKQLKELTPQATRRILGTDRPASTRHGAPRY
jgi:hypothetical protein